MELDLMTDGSEGGSQDQMMMIARSSDCQVIEGTQGEKTT